MHVLLFPFTGYGAWCTCFLVGDNFQRMPFNAVLCGGQWGGACLTYVGAQMMIGGGCIPQMMGRTYLRQKWVPPCVYVVTGTAATTPAQGLSSRCQHAALWFKADELRVLWLLFCRWRKAVHVPQAVAV